MINCYLLDGKFEETTFDNFDEISSLINRNRRELYNLKLDVILEFLTKLGKEIIQNQEINHISGVSYLSLWLRRENLERICRINYTDLSYLDKFKDSENYYELNAQPRGIVCQWVSGEIPTLAVLSLVLSILSKNGSVVKIAEGNKKIMLSILKYLNDIVVERDGVVHSGKEIIRSVAIVSFEGRDPELSKQFSLIADVKIVFGGSEAIKVITSLPQKESCEIIVFGPKYSFGAFDRDFIESDYFDRAIDNAVKDIVIFNQMACSSPHVFFFEKSKFTLKEIAVKMKSSFEKLPSKLIFQTLPNDTATNIINIRAIYLLSNNKEIIQSNDLSWTILLDDNIRLEDPIQGKCVFIKEVDKIDDTLDLITRKIQALGLCVLNEDKKKKFAREAAYRGVDRIISPGKMHDFDQPWDGILSLNRLVRWVILKDS
ncbi:acyl-CoA reductase [Methanosphaerula subterraneus]|uniref:acyl-CoA reductase n=1 Tax=Methanosphaerula subterraneus TaxID=3350244 RepID=UPI003F8546E9